MNLQVMASIPLGQSLSGAIPIANAQPVALQMPAAWTAADITFRVSQDDVTYFDVYNDDGVELAVKVGVGRHIVLGLPDFPGIRFMKLRSGTSGTPVNQAAARQINIITGTVE